MPENGPIAPLVKSLSRQFESARDFNPVGRRLDALAAALDALDAAIMVPGPVPEYHEKIMAKHRREWPTLWAAIDAVRNT